jgi:hypothetical protein
MNQWVLNTLWNSYQRLLIRGSSSSDVLFNHTTYSLSQSRETVPLIIQYLGWGSARPNGAVSRLIYASFITKTTKYTVTFVHDFS